LPAETILLPAAATSPGDVLVPAELFEEDEDDVDEDDIDEDDIDEDDVDEDDIDEDDIDELDADEFDVDELEVDELDVNALDDATDEEGGIAPGPGPTSAAGAACAAAGGSNCARSLLRSWMASTNASGTAPPLDNCRASSVSCSRL
jgi:hypothetical protein